MAFEIKLVNKELAKRANMFPKAGAAALNRSQQTFRVLVVGEVIQRFNIKKSDVNGKIFVNRATPERLVVKMNTSSRRMTVLRFDAKETAMGGGVTVAIVRGNTKVIRGGFINKTKSGQKLVMKRQGKGRYPVDVIRTISITEMMASVHATKDMHNVFLHILAPELERTITVFRELGRE